MAENVNEIADNVGNIQLNDPEALNPPPIAPYVLPEGDVELSFDPITNCAISELSEAGPLGEGQLKDFLREHLDRRSRKTLDIVHNYTYEVVGFSNQLRQIRERMKGIKGNEKDRHDFLKDRVQKLKKALNSGKRIPFQEEVHLSNSAKEAIRHVGNQGDESLLNETEFISFINTGTYDHRVEVEQLIEQLEKFYTRFNNNLSIEYKNYKNYYDKILKAIDDIIKEIA